MKTLSREDIQRMVGRSNSRRNVAGNNQESSSQGFATPSWVDENYLSKSFFSTLFIIHATQTVTVTDDQGQPVGEPTVTEITLAPNLLPGTTSVTDSTTGYTTTTVIAITSIEATKDFYSDGGVSALGQSSGGGGGGASALTDLVDVAISSPTNGQVLMYNSSTGKWYNGTVQSGGGGTVTSITAGTGLTGGTITTSGTIALSEDTRTAIANGATAYGWGDHSQAGYLTSSSLNGYATKAWVQQQGYITASAISDMATKTWVGQQGYITASAISDMATKTWVGQQGFLTSSALNGYATQQWVQQQGYLTSSALNGYATQQWVQQQGYLTSHQSVGGSFWGKSWNNHGTLSGSIDAGSCGGVIAGFHAIELNNHGTLSGYGGYIDFHFNGSLSDYTSRIIEDASGRLFFDNSVGVRIGSVVLSWDSGNNALKIQNIDGTAANFYATGGVSALGMSAGVSTVDAMTFNHLSVKNSMTLSGSVNIITGSSSQIIRTSGDSDCIYLLNYNGSSKVTSHNYYYNQYDNVGLHGTNYNYDDSWFIDPDGCALFQRVYLSNNVYLYTDGSNIKVRIGSTVYTLTKS